MNDKAKAGLAIASIGMVVIIFSGSANLQLLFCGVLFTISGFLKFIKNAKNEG